MGDLGFLDVGLDCGVVVVIVCGSFLDPGEFDNGADDIRVLEQDDAGDVKEEEEDARSSECICLVSVDPHGIPECDRYHNLKYSVCGLAL